MRHSLLFLLAAIFAPLIAVASTSPFAGRWQLDKDRSTALDGWQDWARGRGAKGLAYVLVQDDGSLKGPVERNLSDSEPAEYVVARNSPTEDSVEVPWAQ